MSNENKNQNEMIRDGGDFLTFYKRVCESKTIPELKKWVRKEKHGEVDFKKLLKAEKETKDRKGIKKWVEAILEGRISYEYDLLSWYDLVSILKSSLQKYLRRSETEKAVRTGKRLFLMASRSAIRRLKIIIVEDIDTATPLIGHLHEDMSLRTFLGVVKRTSETPKGSRAHDHKDQLTNLSGLEKDEQKEALKEIIENSDGIERKSAKVFRAMELEESKDQVFEVIERNAVTESLIRRALQGTYFFDDKLHLIISAVLFSEEPDKFIRVEEKPQVNSSAHSIMKFGDLDWYCLDFHTKIGRTALNIFMSKHDSIDRSDMKSAWFKGESYIHIDPGHEEPYNQTDTMLWGTYREYIRDWVEFTRKEIYNLSSYDEF